MVKLAIWCCLFWKTNFRLTYSHKIELFLQKRSPVWQDIHSHTDRHRHRCMLYIPKLQLPIKQEWFQWDSKVQAVDLGRRVSSHGEDHLRCRIRKAMGGETWKIDEREKHLEDNAMAIRNRWLIWGYKAASQGQEIALDSHGFFFFFFDVVCLLVGWLVVGVFFEENIYCKLFIKESRKAQSVVSEVYPREGCFLPCVITAGHGGTPRPAYRWVLIRVSCAQWCALVWGQEEKGLLMVPNMS